MPDQSNLKQIKALINEFKMERIVYLIITVISLIVLLYFAYSLMAGGGYDAVTIASLFGPSGLIAYTSGRLLKMFTISMNVLTALNAGKEVSKDDE